MHSSNSNNHAGHRPSPPNRAVSRSRPRWQPYASALQSAAQSPTAYLNTPPPTASSSAASSHSNPSPCDVISSFDPPAPPRDSAKSKYALGLVDMAAKVLVDIWNPNIVPPPYRPASLTSAYTDLIHQSTSQYVQYVTAAKPNYATSSGFSSPVASPGNFPAAASNRCSQQSLDPRTHAIHLQTFVKEILRRSRTSGCILQTALCYLQAIRGEIPELAEQEPYRPPDTVESPDTVTVKLEPKSAAFATPMSDTPPGSPSDAGVPTVRIQDEAFANLRNMNIGDTDDSSIHVQVNLCPSLLCPRRAFLAALILASKFMQDKSYSNRAWAKLSGLPTREISRCERAMSKALDWRLWVGRGSPSYGGSTAVPNSRALGRSQSDNAILSHPSTPSMPQPDVTPTKRASRTLSRCSTAPAAAFAFTHRKDGMTSSEPDCATSLKEIWAQDNTPCGTLAKQTTLLCSGPVASAMNDVKHQILSAPTEFSSQETPTPPTPALSYSPSSTESSSGDRTIQMATFFEDTTPQSYSARNTSADLWTWLDSSVGPPPKQTKVLPTYGSQSTSTMFPISPDKQTVEIPPWLGLPLAQKPSASAWPIHETITVVK